MSLRVAVVGAGAMGCAWGARLSEAGADVTLVDVDADLVAAIAERGVTLEAPGGERVVRVAATSDTAGCGPVDLVIVFVKTMHTRAAARAAAPLLGPDTHVLTLQNGLGNAEAIAAEVGSDRVLAGVTYDSAVALDKGHVRLANAGAALIGRYDGDVRGVPGPVLAAIAAAGIEVSSTDDVNGLIWGKALVNSVFNATCAITSYRSGEIGDHSSARDFATAVAEETAAVAEALGVRLPYEDPVAKVLETAAGVPTPLNRALTLLVHMIEERAEAARA